MSGSERRRASRFGPVLLASILLAPGCDDGAPSPELRADVATLRSVLLEDAVEGPLAEVERVAEGRPVLGARLLASGALPAARQQLERAQAAAMTSDEGRGFQTTLVEAYEKRVRGLEAWHGYLEDAATDDGALLDALTTLREANQAVVELDRAMDAVTPVAPPPRPD